MFDTIETINNNLNQDHTNFNYHIRARNNKILIEFLRLWWSKLQPTKLINEILYIYIRSAMGHVSEIDRSLWTIF